MDTRVGASFRDPAGYVFERDGTLLRHVGPEGASDYDALVSTGLYDELVSAGRLVPHEEVPPDDGAYRTLRPLRIPFVSYPYEWSFGQLRDAALLTLDVQDAALERGLILKDASAYNVLLNDGRPVHVDTLSFARRRPGQPWLGYGQFCRHFLGPLALMSAVDVRLGDLLRLGTDGVPLDLSSRLLPLRSRLKPGLAIHLHAHAYTVRARVAAGAAPPRIRPMTLNGLRGLTDGLRGTVEALRWDPRGTPWSRYDGDESYSPEGRAFKRRFVEDCVATVGPRTVWDLGANTGEYARIGASRGARVVAFDSDPAAVEQAWRIVRSEGPRSLLPLRLDLTDPSSRSGWGHRERASLEERGPADLLLALALSHHLVIGANVPVDLVAAYFARIGRAIAIEFVPKSDSRVQGMLATREDVFQDYTAERFERAFEERFVIRRRDSIPGSHRLLYLMERRSS